MLCTIAILVLVLPAVASQTCNMGKGNTTICGGQYIKIVFDISSFMKTQQAIQQHTTSKEFDFLANRVLPLYAYGHTYWFEHYGGRVNKYQFCAVNNDCDCVNKISDQIAEDSLGTMTLTDLFTNHYGMDYVTIFTATTDQADIDSARKHIKGDHLKLINMATGVDYSEWANAGACVINQPLPFPPGFEWDIIKVQCGTDLSKCFAPSKTSSTVIPTTTTTTSTTPSTTTTTTTSTTTTSTTTSPPPLSPCPCNPSTIWNDVIVLFDGSYQLRQEQFNSMTSLVQGALAQLPIGQTSENQTRVGFYVYGDSSVEVAALNAYNSVEEMISQTFTHLTDDFANVEGAILTAMSQFNKPGHRRNARPVILLTASEYRQGSYNSPIPMAQVFKNDGGIIIVIEYGSRTAPSPILQQVASPGFYIDASNYPLDIDAFVDMQCTANCFCPKPYQSVSTSAHGEPTDGCFMISEDATVKEVGKRNCVQQDNGRLAMPKDTIQKVFTSNTPNKDSVFVGMTQLGGTWTWDDGTVVTDSVTSSGTGTCAVIKKGNGFGTEFVQSSCTGIYKYGCQTTPCSSENYCPQ